MLAIVYLALLAATAAPMPPTEVALGTTETAFAGVLVTAILGALGVLVRYLVRKSGSNLARLALGRLQWAVGVAVRDVYQTYVEELKQFSADGKLTEDESKKALSMALVRAKSLLGMEGVKLLVKALGADRDSLSGFLTPHIEAEIADAKKAGGVLKGVAVEGSPVDPPGPSVVV